VACAPVDDVAEWRPLIESIRTHGIVHPLLVRRHHDGYQVVAGRKRLAAAHVLRLPTVPCIVREVSQADGAALAAADNLSSDARPAAKPRDFAAVRRLAADHLVRVIRAADLPVGDDHGLDGCGADLLKAHAWRARRLLDAVDLLEQPWTCDERASCAIAPAIEEVVSTCASEAQLRWIALRTEIDGYHSAAIDRRPLEAAIAGALTATFAVVSGARRATIAVRAFRRSEQITIEVAQSDRTVSQAALDDLLRTDAATRPSVDASASIGALTAQTILERCHGTIEFAASAGTRITMSIPAART